MNRAEQTGLEAKSSLFIHTRVNGKSWEGEVAPHTTLLDFLRNRLGLKGTKLSCDMQVCGACTVLVNGKAVSSCTSLAYEIRDKEVLTIEGLAHDEELDPLQQAFIDQNAVQCGYCTSGMILMAKALLLEKSHPTPDDVREFMEGVLCRCGTYKAVEEAILSVSSRQARS